MINLTIPKEKLRVAAAYLMYFFSLQTVYTVWIVDIFAYEGYRDDLSFEKGLLSFLIICASVLFLRSNFNPSTVFTNCALALVLIPSLVLYSGSDLDNYFLFVTFTAFLLIVASSKYLAVSRFTVPS
jgi:hypothetical protein